MKKIFFILILIVYSSCVLDEAKREEIKKRRAAQMKILADCILRNEKTSDALRKSIEENKDNDVIRALHPRGQKLEKADEEIIRECRREMINVRKEELRREREQKMKETAQQDGRKDDL